MRQFYPHQNTAEEKREAYQMQSVWGLVMARERARAPPSFPAAAHILVLPVGLRQVSCRDDSRHLRRPKRGMLPIATLFPAQSWSNDESARGVESQLVVVGRQLIDVVAGGLLIDVLQKK